MAIGTAAAIGLGVAGIGSALGGMSSNKAAGKAADAQTQASAQQTAMQREMYNNNVNLLSPYIQAGVPATQNINALLGIGMGSPLAASGGGGGMVGGGGPNWNQYLQENPDVARDAYRDKLGRTPEQYAEYHWNVFGNQEGRKSPYTVMTTGATGATGATQSAVGQPTAQQAFDTFRNSTGYQFRLNQGLDAVNGGYAGAGTIKSGAAMKAINDYGQGMASQEFANYLGALGNQQSVGMGAASAAAGVGQNTANSLSQISQNAADARSNAALSKTNPLANSLSLIGGGIFGAR